ncbi:TetR/AcrR family transcriptional regulator [Chitinophaga sedimenti]|uniref:TetR/AcrR family transcriptional regulator n=1 Tax=Chitinophaga sedimenti TaxID=2033606 RepID=UPI002004119C|nr:TetR/AcrR family transcriptional regulator [Chitinophaga sedimenti]MCK7556425.1 TetR/AcrR family transcriptional regulator [Chitinophaga sedimenti]
MRLRDEQKQAIVHQAALKMIVEDGLDGLSMQKLAKAAGISPATIYIYYKDRDDLILQVCATEGRKMEAATLEGFSPEMSLREGLKVQWQNRSRYCLENPLGMQFLEQIRHSPYQARAAKQVTSRFVEELTDFVRINRERGEMVDGVSTEVFWAIAYAPLYSLIKFHLQGRGLAGMDRPFQLTEEKLDEALALTVKALTP